jgi:hypothetical protein
MVSEITTGFWIFLSTCLFCGWATILIIIVSITVAVSDKRKPIKDKDLDNYIL